MLQTLDTISFSYRHLNPRQRKAAPAGLPPGSVSLSRPTVCPNWPSGPPFWAGPGATPGRPRETRKGLFQAYSQITYRKYKAAQSYSEIRVTTFLIWNCGRPDDDVDIMDTMSGGLTEQTGGKSKFDSLIQAEVDTREIRRRDSTKTLGMRMVINEQRPVPNDQAVQNTRQKNGETSRVSQQQSNKYKIARQSGSQKHTILIIHGNQTNTGKLT